MKNRRISLTLQMAVYSMFVVCAVMGGWVAESRATLVLITSAKTVGPLDTTITATGSSTPVPLSEADIIVRGTTLTMDGRFTIASLTVERNVSNQPGIVTHSQGAVYDYPDERVEGLSLNVTGNASIESVGGVISRISVSGRGHEGSTGWGAGGSAEDYNGGGAGFGGAGGDANGSSQAVLTPGGLGGYCYGFESTNLFTPNSLGSGGGNAWSGGVPNENTGGVGGGAIRLTISGSLLLAGQINADGMPGTYVGCCGLYGGGGSGGSIDIDCGSISGSGKITAIGGSGGGNTAGGGGGGGRIGLYYASGSIANIERLATGSIGYFRGGAGTIFTRLAADARGTMTIDNGNGTNGEATEFYGPIVLDANVIIQKQGRLGPAHLQDDFDVTILGDLNVMSNAYVSANGRGFPGSSGPFGSQQQPGPGWSAEGYNGGGGAYGGAGGDSNGSSQAELTPGGLGGDCYGFDRENLTHPALLGAGGGNAWSGGQERYETGGASGGSIRLVVEGALTLAGHISANGAAGTYVGCCGLYGGGGSGGSIDLICGSIAGTSGSSITANGGDAGGTTAGGGGGGGRIAIQYSAGSLTQISRLAAGGSGSVRGGAGTVYTKAESESRGTLTIDNNNADGDTTEFYGSVTIDANVVIQRLGRLGPAHYQSDFDLTILGDLSLTSSGSVYAIGRGFPGSVGPLGAQDPGPGGSADGHNGGGGGYGGAGGGGGLLTPGGTTYGAANNPIDLGSGGGNAWIGGAPDYDSGGAGGGSVRLTVIGTISLSGQINASGAPGKYVGCCGLYGGGGSGGGINLSCGAINGTGSIVANGGNAGGGVGGPGGGGGGGRIAIRTTCPATPPIFSIQYSGGVGSQSGSPGTLFWSEPVTGDMNGNSLLDMGDVPGFVNVLLGLDSALCHLGTADLSGDGRADGEDVAPFVEAMLGL